MPTHATARLKMLCVHKTVNTHVYNVFIDGTSKSVVSVFTSCQRWSLVGLVYLFHKKMELEVYEEREVILINISVIK